MTIHGRADVKSYVVDRNDAVEGRSLERGSRQNHVPQSKSPLVQWGLHLFELEQTDFPHFGGCKAYARHAALARQRVGVSSTFLMLNPIFSGTV